MSCNFNPGTVTGLKRGSPFTWPHILVQFFQLKAGNWKVLCFFYIVQYTKFISCVCAGREILEKCSYCRVHWRSCKWGTLDGSQKSVSDDPGITEHLGHKFFQPTSTVLRKVPDWWCLVLCKKNPTWLQFLFFLIWQVFPSSDNEVFMITFPALWHSCYPYQNKKYAYSSTQGVKRAVSKALLIFQKHFYQQCPALAKGSITVLCYLESEHNSTNIYLCVCIYMYICLNIYLIITNVALIVTQVTLNLDVNVIGNFYL